MARDLGSRIAAHERLSKRLAALSDDDLAALAQTGEARRGVGGESSVVEIDGAPVFRKQIYLTDLERANPGATANLFDLPLFYHYGVGSAGFGAWRELAAYQKAHAWAVSGACERFCLLHHWRVLPRTPPAPSDDEAALLARRIDYWGGGAAIRARLEGMRDGAASLVLLLEHVPQNLAAWLGERAGDERLGPALAWAHEQTRAAAAFMNAHGMLHFDLHGLNLLTDGEDVFVGDFGLAICDDFDLAPAERAFFETHRLYDRAYVGAPFTAWLTRPPAALLTPEEQVLNARCGPAARLITTFLDAVRDNKQTPYPAADIAAALAAAAPP